MSQEHTPLSGQEPNDQSSTEPTLDLTPLLYPELYEEGEVEEARAALARSPKAQRELERLTQGVERARQASERNAARLSEGVSLSAQQRHALLREAQSAHAHTQRSSRAPLSEQLRALFFSPQLAWVGVLGLMTVSVWRYQESLELNERASLTPEVLSHPDLATPLTPQPPSGAAIAELDVSQAVSQSKEAQSEDLEAQEPQAEGAPDKAITTLSTSRAPQSEKLALPSEPQAQADEARQTRKRARKIARPRRSARGRAVPSPTSTRSQRPKRPKRSKDKSLKSKVWRSKTQPKKTKAPQPTPQPIPEPTQKASAERELTQQAQFAPPPPPPKVYAPPPPPPAPTSASSSRSTEDLIASVSSVPWAEADAHDQAGRTGEAISSLETWLTAHMSHPRAREAARLGQRWARAHKDRSAERRFTAYLRSLERQGGAGGSKQSSPRKRRLKSKSTMSF